MRKTDEAIKIMMSNMKKLEEEKVELMEDCACQYKQIQKLESENEDLREVNKETVKQCLKQGLRILYLRGIIQIRCRPKQGSERSHK